MSRKTRLILFLSFAFGISSLFAQEQVEQTNEVVNKQKESLGNGKQYKIKTIDFNSNGKTKAFALKRTIPDIDYSRIFDSKEELEGYLHDVYQDIENTRLLRDIEYSYETEESTEDGITFVVAEYSFYDTHPMIIFPRPSFNTNSGIELKLKLKDNNFIGLMEDLNIDLNLNFGDKDEPENYSKVIAGFNFEYDFPFNIGITEDTWSNDLAFSWEIGNHLPEYEYETGIKVSVPLGQSMHKLQMTFTQSIAENFDYAKYGDEFYFTENAKIYLPLFVGYIGNTTQVIYTPSVTFTYIWDKDGIDPNNDDLNQTPKIRVGQSIGFDNVNWIKGNNFRTGYSFSVSQLMGFDLGTESLDEMLVPSVYANLKLFKGFKYIGFAFNAIGFAGWNTKIDIGQYIRGAPDRQTFRGYEVDDNNYALKTPAAIVFSLDIPIHIVTTHWLDWSYSLFGSYDTKPKFVKGLAFLPRKIFRYIDFELQLSPFVDAALLKNRGTGSNLNYKEGIYTGGLEVLVYPEKWKSFIIRGSIGLDISKEILDGHLGFDSSWRGGKAWEAFIGLGLQF